MTYNIKCPDGTRYRVRQAVNLQAALHEIVNARVTGSIGGITTMYRDGIKTVIASVIQINSDGTERKPGYKAY